MPTTGTILAKVMKIYTGGTPAALTCQVNASISAQTEMFQTTCKDSGANAEYLPGTKSWTASVEGNFAADATNGFEDLYTSYSNQTSVAIVFQNAVTGDLKYSGSAYISSLDLVSDGNDTPVTWSAEFQGTGALTQATIA